MPPYVIFHDATLKEMLDRRPATLAEMLTIHGVGQAKLERYGEAFLDALRAGEDGEERSAHEAQDEMEIREEFSWQEH